MANNLQAPQSKDSHNTPKEIDTSGMIPLGQDFKPGEFDVICARGAKARNHSGNRYFRELIKNQLEAYSKATVKIEKSKIVSKIINSIRAKSPHGGFVKEVGGSWFDVGDHIAREKAGQSFRDLLHTKYKSSTKAKMARRKKRGSSIESSDESTTGESIAISQPIHAYEGKDKANTVRSELKVEPMDTTPVPFASAPDTSQDFQFTQLHKQRHNEPASTDILLRASIHSLHEENTWANAIGTIQELGLSDNAGINWEYGPISFQRFEQRLQIDGLPDEQISASIFDPPCIESNMNQTEAIEMQQLEVNRPPDHWGMRNPAYDTACLAFEQDPDIMDQSIRSFREDSETPPCCP